MPEVRLEIPRSPRFYPVELPSEPSFHPELGYLLPSPSLGRKLRNAAVAAVIGLGIAASTAVALMPRPELTSATGNHEEPLAAALPQPIPTEEAVPAILLPRAAPAPARAQGSACDDLSTSFLAPECRFGRAGKGKAVRAARGGHKLTTVTIGRAGGENEPREAALAQTAPSSPATDQAEATAKAPEPAAAPPKPKPAAKVARKPDRRPGFDAAAADGPGPRGNSGGAAFPGVVPSLFGGEWARSW